MDSSSLWEHIFLSPRCPKRACRRSSLSAGSCNSLAMVSITIPRTDKEVEGPSCLWAAIGMLKFSQTRSNMASDSAHCCKCGGPMITKSSK